MATTINKQRLVTHLATLSSEPSSELANLPILEQLLYGLCRENATREQADAAFTQLRERFFDWNEVRVSSTRELADVFEGMSFPEQRAERLLALLQEVFETTYAFDLDSLQKKGVKQAAKQLSRYEATNAYLVSWVVQNGLAGHAIPVDPPTLRIAQRLGLIEETETDTEAAQGSLEHLIPKAKGTTICDALSQIAHDHCHEEEPRCTGCPLARDCPSARSTSSSRATLSTRTKVKPR